MSRVAQLTPELTQRRRLRRLGARSSRAGRLGLGCSVALSLVLLLGLLVPALVYVSAARDLPSLETLPALLEPPGGVLLQPTRLYDRSGEHLLLTLQNPAAADSRYLLAAPPAASQGSPGDQFLPTALISATLASTDPGFWQHAGIAVENFNLTAPTTLAMRLVDEHLLWQEQHSLRRNLRRQILALQLTARFGRLKVLEWYLNSASYGRLAYGADAAARAYFDKPASQLSLTEAAALAALAQVPTSDPLAQPENLRQRQRQIIHQMEQQGLVSLEQALAADQQTVRFSPAQSPVSHVEPAFTNLVLEQLSLRLGRSRLERGGFKILTTLDYDLQGQAACAAEAQLRRLQAPRQLEPIADQDCPAARLLPTLTYPAGQGNDELAASLLVMDPTSGQVLALVATPAGSPGPAASPGRPAGTLLTPFLYLTAFTRGFSPASLVWDIPAQGEQASLEEPTGQHRGPMRLRTAMANDILAPANRLVEQVGSETIRRTLREFGLELPETDVENLPWEGAQATLLQLGQAYSTFANQGSQAGQSIGLPGQARGLVPLQPSSVLQVQEAGTGRIWLDWSQPEVRPLISAALAYLVTHVLSDETARWLSLGHPNPLEIGRPAAVKLGRTAEGLDSWTVGYTPQRLAAVWVGATGSQSPGPAPLASAALWHALMQIMQRDLPLQAWAQPPGISTLEVCDPSGLLPSQECPAVVSEVFLSGSEPNQVDNLYQRVQVNRDSGRLATIFTPADLVEERLFLDVPVEAHAWAQNAGLDLPPEEFDSLPVLPPASPDVDITSPEMFAPLSGQVAIRGNARGEDFAFYRLQVGSGLNPRAWVQIGQDTARPVSAGILANWDTSGLNGLYAIQLLVVRKDQQVQEEVVLVTIDNQAPQVTIAYPTAGQALQRPAGTPVTLRAQVEDDPSVQQVEFFLDGRRIGVLSQPPYALPWRAVPGDHTLKVVATDSAGNQAEAEIVFKVD